MCILTIKDKLCILKLVLPNKKKYKNKQKLLKLVQPNGKYWYYHVHYNGRTK